MTDFPRLTFYLANLEHSLICSKSFLEIPWDCLYRQSCHIIEICMPFISFSYFITLPMTFSIMLSRSCEYEQPCLVLNLRKKAFSLSPCMLVVAFI